MSAADAAVFHLSWRTEQDQSRTSLVELLHDRFPVIIGLHPQRGIVEPYRIAAFREEVQLGVVGNGEDLNSSDFVSVWIRATNLPYVSRSSLLIRIVQPSSPAPEGTGHR